MAGETIAATAVCLAIHPWSRTSHVVRWLTPDGPLTTLVKGAVRPKSAFLGQYDLNYTCEILFYARAKRDVHPLREAYPVALREALRADYRRLALADLFRCTAGELAPTGPDAKPWYDLLESALDELAATPFSPIDALRLLLDFDMKALSLFGISPNIEAEQGSFALRGERRLPISPVVAHCLRHPRDEKKYEILLDATRVIGVFYNFHLDCALDVRKTVLRMISNNKEQGNKDEH